MMDKVLRVVESPAISPLITLLLAFSLIVIIAKIFGKERRELLEFIRQMAIAEVANPVGRVCLVGTAILGFMFTLALVVEEFREFVSKVLKTENIGPILNANVGIIFVSFVLIVNFLVLHANTKPPRR